jgi:hypothetical protein
LNPEEFETKALSGACAWCHDATISSVPSNALRAPVIVANPSGAGSVRAEEHRQVSDARFPVVIVVTPNVHRRITPLRRAVGGDIREARW